MCARVPAGQSAPLTIRGHLIGRSDPPHAQGSRAKSGGTRRAECGDSHPLSENSSAFRVPGATSAGRPAAGDHQEAADGAAPGRPAKRRDGVRAGDRAGARAPWRRPPSGRARGDAAGARGATVLADPAPRVTARGLAREPARAGRAWCRGTRRAREVRRGSSDARLTRNAGGVEGHARGERAAFGDRTQAGRASDSPSTGFPLIPGSVRETSHGLFEGLPIPHSRCRARPRVP